MGKLTRMVSGQNLNTELSSEEQLDIEVVKLTVDVQQWNNTPHQGPLHPD